MWIRDIFEAPAATDVGVSTVAKKRVESLIVPQVYIRPDYGEPFEGPPKDPFGD